ncbi:aldose 1-epimerase family protein [Paenibacillus sp. OV219]|uniref:aldose 1-epimerase family protein n=1 Tax=Paenibacillus sp. OV219 TaxID=1884377 RepID=UPI0008D223B5|nr:aldose 1-epimerase family protein [Paenibacillus sp. OV219]SEO51687.1 protein of unknown function [Paenibacillus sp. OV219]
MKLYGKNYARREIEARVGRIEQIGGIRKLTLADGNENGSSVISVRTGAGLAFDVMPDKGLDLSAATFSGNSVSWQSANGDVHPSYYDDKDMGWLRTASGGLLMTCGLINVGSPSSSGGKSYGLHGRAHHTPAKQVVAEGYWAGDEYEIRIAGIIEESSMFGGHLRLRREIRTRLGENRISIRDVVENAGFEACPHMLLYHFNFGFPLLTEQTELVFPKGNVRAIVEGVPVEGYEKWTAPAAPYHERVYYHDLEHAADGRQSVTIRQPEFPIAAGQSAPIALTLSWNSDTLPKLSQWKMPGAGIHVLGIEPSNCGVEGMETEKERGTLVMLEPGESREYELDLTIV